MIFLILFFTLMSCGASSTMNLRKNGSGKAELEVRLTAPVVEYFLDIAEISGYEASRDALTLFDLPAIRKRLSGIKGLSITRLTSPTQGELNLSFTFSSLDSLISSGKNAAAPDVLSWSGGAESAFRLQLNREAVSDLLSLLLQENASAFDYLLPQKGESRTEYDENLAFALDDGPTLFSESMLTFTLNVEGSVISHNGEQVDPHTVRFRIPLADLLFLEKPVVYEVVFR